MSFVARYTPVYIVANDVFNICTIEELAAKYGGGLWTPLAHTSTPETFVSGVEVCELTGVYSWSDNGWTRIFRVIRHELAPNTMTRIMTHHGLVDTTDETAAIGTEMLHHRIPTETYAEYIKNNNKEYDISGITDHLLMANYSAKKQSQDFNIRLSNMSSIMAGRSRFRRASSGNLNITISKEPYTNSDCEIQGFKQLSADEGYVYSLTSENHHFAAGIGNMILNGFD